MDQIHLHYISLVAIFIAIVLLVLILLEEQKNNRKNSAGIEMPPSEKDIAALFERFSTT